MPKNAASKAGKKDKILVISIDRDNDIGEKTKLKGPFIGRESVLKSAVALGLADPSDSDSNALFQTIKVFDDLKNEYHAEIAALTGDKNVGITSDAIISSQLDAVLRRFKANYAVFVSDGAQDEQVMPIIQSKVPILSVNKVIVKQSEALESGYYKIKDFISESLDNPKFSRLIFGLPAIVLVLFAVFGAEGTRAVLGILGAYLIIKGFKLEHIFTGVWDEIMAALSRKRAAFFMYIIGGIFFALALYRGMTGFFEFLDIGIFETIAGFLSPSIYFFFLSATFIWVGRNVLKGTRSTKKIASVIIFSFSVSLVIFNAAELILEPSLSVINFIFSIILGFILIFIAVVLELK